MTKILLIEDNTELALIVVEALSGKYDVTHVASLAEANKRLVASSYNIILLDVGLPDGSGFLWYENFQKQNNKKLRVIFLTGKSDLGERLKGLKLGAADYIVKPFYMAELSARIEIQVRNLESQNHLRLCGDLKLDLSLQRLYLVHENGKEEVLNLTPNEFKIFSFLCEKKGAVVSRNEIVSIVWGEGTHLSEKVVNTHISNLRKKLNSKRCKIIAEGNGYLLQTN